MIQKPFRGVQLNRTHPLAKGLVGCYVFNEATGETVFDLSSNGNNGTLENGVVWGSDGLDYDGNNDYVDCGSMDTAGSAITISLYVKSPVFSSVYQSIYSQNGVEANLKNVQIYTRTGGNSMIAFNVVDGTNRRLITVGNILDDKWMHIICVWDGASSSIVYINGIPHTEAQSIATQGTTYGNTAIGYSSNVGTVKSFNGSIGSAFIHNRALSAEEVTWLYREPYAMFEPAFNPALLYSAAPPVGAIMNQFQRANIGADLYNGVFA